MRITPPAVLAACLLVTACASDSAISASQHYRGEGQVLFAYQELESARQHQLDAGGTVDSALEAAYQETRIAWLVEQARQLIYENREEEALQILAEVEAAQPGHGTASSLADRAHRKLADRAVLQGQRHLLAKNELDKALVCFETALRHSPNHQGALTGRQDVQLAVSRLHREAQVQFLDAIRKLPELRFSEVDWHAGVALQRDASRTDAESVRQRAQRELAETERRRAEQSQTLGSYGAALMCYRSAARLYPKLPGIDEAIAQMQREVDAELLIEKAALAIRANKLEPARKMLDQAFQLSTLERGTISELIMEARRREAELAYAQARDLELQGKKQEALAAFTALSKDWPDGLLDEKTHISGLESDIQGAQKALEEGEAAEQKNDLKQALEHYRAAQTYYPDHGDLKARIERVTAALAAQGVRGGS